MRAHRSFLDEKELAEFTQPGRVMRRRVTRIATGARPTQSPPLSHLFVERLREARGRRPRFFECACIRVPRGDGMTWSAETVARELEAHHDPDAIARGLQGRSTWVYRISGGARAEKLPPVASLIGERRLLELAASESVVEPFLSIRNGHLLRGATIAVVCGALALFLTGAASSDRNRGAALRGTAIALFASMAVVTGGIGTRYIPTRKSTEARKEMLGLLREDAANLEDGERRIDALARDISEALARGPFPRWVVVDDWERLDVVTQRALQLYFKEGYTARGGAELWVVFEGEDGDLLSTLAIDRGFAQIAWDDGSLERMTLYRQEPLTEAERVELARRTGHEDRSGYLRVRQIGSDEEPVDEEVAAELLKQAPERAGARQPTPLGLLHLLSLADAGEAPVLGKAEVERYAFGDRDRRDVLEHFMGRLPSRLELQDLADQVGTRFRAALVPTRGDRGRFRVRAAVGPVLQREGDRLGLAPAALGHLFWALVWQAERSGRPHRAFWVRRLVRHCLAANTAALPPELRRRLDERLFEVMIFTVRAALRTALLDDAPVLLERTRSLMEDAGLTGARHADQLRRVALEAFVLLGDPLLLLSPARLPAAEQEGAGAPDDAPVDLAAYGLALLPLGRAERGSIAAALHARRRKGAADADLLRTRAAWLALTASTSGEVFGLALQEAYLGDRSLPHAVEAAERRLLNARPAEGAWLADAAIVGEGAWNEALRTGAQFAQQEARLRYRADPSAGLHPELFLTQEMFFAVDSPQRVAAAAGRVVGVAERLADLSRQDGAGLRGTEFAVTAMVRELCTLAWAALLANSAHAGPLLSAAAGPGAHEAALAVTRRAAALLHEPLPEDDPFSPDAARRVDGLLSLAEMLWSTMGLTERAEAVALRQAQLALALKSAGTPSDRMEELLNTLGPTLNHPGLHGLVARVVAASVPDSAQAIRAGYARHAATLAADPALGSVVRRDFALYALLVGHAFAADAAGPLVADLMEPGPGGMPVLARLLAETPAHGLDDLFLIYLNATDDLDDAELRAAVRRLLEARLAELPEGREHALLGAMLALKEAERAGGADGVPAASSGFVLGLVDELHDTWVYPWALRLLLQAGAPDSTVLHEAVRQLRRDDRDETVSTYYTLAQLLSREQFAPSLDPQERDEVGSYLRRLVHRWESKATVRSNLSVYRYLSRWDPQGEESYRERLEHWEHEQVKEDHQLRFPELARSGRWFLIFRDCVLHMHWWGLPLGPGDLYARLGADDDERDRAVREWAAAGGRASPFLSWPDDEVVSTDFVVLGSYLFGRGLGADPELDAHRLRFDEEARIMLPRLFACMTRLPSLPPSVKDLLVEYAGRFQSEFLAGAGDLVRLPA